MSGVGSGCTYFWKSKGLSDERVNSITASNYSITPQLSYYDDKIRKKFNGSCLKQDKSTYDHGKIANIYIVFEINKNYNISSYPTLENCFYLVQLVSVKMLMLMSINILVMKLDLIEKGSFHVVMDLVEI